MCYVFVEASSAMLGCRNTHQEKVGRHRRYVAGRRHRARPGHLAVASVRTGEVSRSRRTLAAATRRLPSRLQSSTVASLEETAVEDLHAPVVESPNHHHADHPEAHRSAYSALILLRGQVDVDTAWHPAWHRPWKPNALSFSPRCKCSLPRE